MGESLLKPLGNTSGGTATVKPPISLRSDFTSGMSSLVSVSTAVVFADFCIGLDCAFFASFWASRSI